MNSFYPLIRRAHAALFVCCLSLVSALSGAATFTVTNTADDLSAGSLRKAIETAADLAGADTIDFDASLSGQAIRLTQQLTIDSELTIDASALPGGIIISGDQSGNGPTADDSRVFYITGADVTLISLTITEGFAQSGSNGDVGIDGGDGTDGGGIHHGSGNLTLRRCTIAYNRSGRGGNGGAGIDGAGDGVGGAGGQGGNGGLGGGIYHASGTLTLEQCTVAHNSSGDGGIGGTGGSGGAGDMGGGGGTGAPGGSGGHGGGIFNSSGTLILVQCTLSHNNSGDGSDGGTGGSGGGSSGDGGTGGSGGNGSDGGGIYRSGGTVSITDSIIAGNLIGAGGYGGAGGLGILSGINGPNGDGGDGPDLNTDSSITAGGINLIGDNTLATGLASAAFPAGSFVGTGGAPLDALLGALADNGGPTETLLPLPGSPAIDPAGGASASGFPTDQRGYGRIVGGIVDIGAVEYGAVPVEDTSDADAAAAKVAQRADLSRKLKKLKKKLKNAKRKGKKAKAKKFKKQIKKVKKLLRVL